MHVFQFFLRPKPKRPSDVLQDVNAFLCLLMGANAFSQFTRLLCGPFRHLQTILHDSGAFARQPVLLLYQYQTAIQSP
jgi:hypothetical protein